MVEDRRYARHAELVSKMADRTGLDLDEAQQRGQISADNIEDLVHRCEGCTQPEECARLLARGSGEHRPPAYCRNAQAFERLKR